MNLSYYCEQIDLVFYLQIASTFNSHLAWYSLSSAIQKRSITEISNHILQFQNYRSFYHNFSGLFHFFAASDERSVRSSHCQESGWLVSGAVYQLLERLPLLTLRPSLHRSISKLRRVDFLDQAAAVKFRKWKMSWRQNGAYLDLVRSNNNWIVWYSLIKWDIPGEVLVIFWWFEATATKHGDVGQQRYQAWGFNLPEKDHKVYIYT